MLSALSGRYRSWGYGDSFDEYFGDVDEEVSSMSCTHVATSLYSMIVILFYVNP